MKSLFPAVAIAIGLHAFLLTRGSNWLSRKSHFPPVKHAVTMTLTYVKPVEKRVAPSPKIAPKPLIKTTAVPRPKAKTVPKPVIRAKPEKHVKKIRRKVSKPPVPLPKKRHKEERPKPAAVAVKPARKVVPIHREQARYEEPLKDEVVEELLSDPPDPIHETPESGPPDLETPPEVSAVVKLARPLYKINPHPSYPKVARRRGYEGRVVLEVLVMKTGRVGDIRIFRSSGHRRLDRAAQDGVKKWRFEPGTRNGIPVGMKVKVPIRFKLD